MLDFHVMCPPEPNKHQANNRLAKPGNSMPVRTYAHTI